MHYAGNVTYDPALFYTKNEDLMSEDLQKLVTGSSYTFCRELFTEDRTATSSAGGGSAAAAQGRKTTVGKAFRGVGCTEMKCRKDDHIWLTLLPP